MSSKFLNDCASPDPSKKLNLDPNAPPCSNDVFFKDCDGVEQGLFHQNSIKDDLLGENQFYKNDVLGYPNYADPMITGNIVNDPKAEPMAVDRAVIYRNTHALRAADQGVKELFNNIVVEDDRGKILPVPIIWGSQEKAVQVALQPNVRKDNTGVVDAIRLPIMSVYTSRYEPAMDRYLFHQNINWHRTGEKYKDKNGTLVGHVNGIPGKTEKERYERDTVLGTVRGFPINLGYTLTVWTMFWEDMNQIVTQIATKFSPVAYIKLRDIPYWETILKLDSINTNLDLEPGDINLRVFKYQFEFTLETFIPMPIVKRKAVLKTRIDLVQDLDKEIQCVIGKIEKAIAELDE